MQDLAGTVDDHVCRARVALSLVSLASMYVDPMVGGPFAISRPALLVLAFHLAYSLFAYRFLTRAADPPRRAVRLGFTIADVIFAALIASATEGVTSPSYLFFCFAILAVAFQQGWCGTAHVLAVSVPAYLVTIVAFARNAHPEWLMRPGYLGLIGLFAGSLGQQRIDFESRVRELEGAEERRSVARALHDGYVPALAAARLKLEACRALLVLGRTDEATEEIEALKASMAREYDEVRSYLRSLAAVPLPAAEESSPPPFATRFRVHADFADGGAVTEQVLQILLEGVRNTIRHAGARSACLEAHGDGAAIRIRVDDDGTGFRPHGAAPWSITSRVDDLGGSLAIEGRGKPGAHLRIELPRSKT